LRFVGAEGQRRQQAHDLVGGDVDQQTGVEATVDQFAARAIEFDADHQALAADVDHAPAAGQRLRQTLTDQTADDDRIGRSGHRFR
jgi:hypothetical protein